MTGPTHHHKGSMGRSWSVHSNNSCPSREGDKASPAPCRAPNRKPRAPSSCFCLGKGKETVLPSNAPPARAARPRGMDVLGCHWMPWIGEDVGFRESLSEPIPSFVSHPIAHSAHPDPQPRTKRELLPGGRDSAISTDEPTTLDLRSSRLPAACRSVRHHLLVAESADEQPPGSLEGRISTSGEVWRMENGVEGVGTRHQKIPGPPPRQQRFRFDTPSDMVAGTGWCRSKNRGISWLWFQKPRPGSHLADGCSTTIPPSGIAPSHHRHLAAVFWPMAVLLADMIIFAQPKSPRLKAAPGDGACSIGAAKPFLAASL